MDGNWYTVKIGELLPGSTVRRQFPDDPHTVHVGYVTARTESDRQPMVWVHFPAYCSIWFAPDDKIDAYLHIDPAADHGQKGRWIEAEAGNVTVGERVRSRLFFAAVGYGDYYEGEVMGVTAGTVVVKYDNPAVGVITHQADEPLDRWADWGGAVTATGRTRYLWAEELLKDMVRHPVSKRVSARICHSYGIDGVCDPGYIASVIDSELARWFKRPFGQHCEHGAMRDQCALCNNGLQLIDAPEYPWTPPQKGVWLGLRLAPVEGEAWVGTKYDRPEKGGDIHYYGPLTGVQSTYGILRDPARAEQIGFYDGNYWVIRGRQYSDWWIQVWEE
ncbi:MAG: hypothetical protein FOGNACKC_00805 [Anaerolineae bacterium]|nr:hypothetical protein [Anaerolineae bacterium]